MNSIKLREILTEYPEAIGVCINADAQVCLLLRVYNTICDLFAWLMGLLDVSIDSRFHGNLQVKNMQKS